MVSEDSKYWTGSWGTDKIDIQQPFTFETGSLIIEVPNDCDKKDIGIYQVETSGNLSEVEKIGRDNIIEIIANIAAKKISCGDIRLFNESVRLELFEKIKLVFKEVEDKYATNQISKKDTIK